MINFFTQDLKFALKNKTLVRNWLTATAKNEGATIEELNYIFCSDNYLLALNKKHLNHNTLTDIITFDNSAWGRGAKDGGRQLSPRPSPLAPRPQLTGDIFISIDRVNENAEKFNTTFEKELQRVMIHGLLHLLGYKDKKPTDKAMMTEKEDYYLKRF